MLIDFRDRERRERERNTNEREALTGLPFIHSLTKDQTHNLGMCPGQNSNPQPLALQDDTPTK